jgi:hypothetical protein
VKILKIGLSAGNFCNNFKFYKKALRDCTPHTQTASAAGDEPVQTTTQNNFVAGESQCGK